jgi:polysaccharide pyruvyl transferase WcaK-like protein
MKKVLLVGGYGYQDLGDESQLTAVLLNLKKFVPNARYIALSDNLENTQKYHDVETNFSLKHYLNSPFFIRRKQRTEASTDALRQTRNSNPFRARLIRILMAVRKLLISLILVFNAQRIKKDRNPLFLNEGLKHFLVNLKSCALLFDVGGGNLTSVWRGELRIKCLTFILARIFEKPIILSGQTIGPFHGFFDKVIARYALNRANIITLRERFSETNLRKIRVTKPLIKVTADDSATLLPANQIRIETIFSNERIEVKRPLIGINIISLKYLQKLRMEFKKAKELLANIADYLIEKFDATVIFIPTQYGADDDRKPASEILQVMTNKDRAFLLSQEYNDKEIKGIICQLDLAIGFRYHFIVFAVTSGVPAIGIYLDDYYATKINGILALVNQEENGINIRDATFNKTTRRIEEVFSNREQIAQSLREQTGILQKRSLTTIRFAAKILSK